jgi:ABC-type lipoprotein release transport system permease subunit
MLLFIRLAWRNMFRNKRRTVIAGIAIGMGLASLIFVDALWIGMEQNMIKSATASFLGEGQIHHQNYRQTQEVSDTIQNLSKVKKSLDQEQIVEYYTLRVFAMGMITSPANVQSVRFSGVDPPTEKNLSQLDEAIVEGSFFKGTSERDLLIGKDLAEILEVGLGDRVVVTVVQVETGDLSQEMFRISGIYHFNIQEMDRLMAFARLSKVQEMLGIGNAAHEIAIKFIHSEFGQDKELSFWDKYSQSGNEAVNWTTLLPQLEAAFELSQFSTLITALILFGVVALGIINTLFMSIHERMFEFGVIRAIGTRPFNVSRLILFEAASLAVISIILGNILGFIATFITSRIGIDYTGIEFVGVTFRELIYPKITLNQFIIYPIWVFIFTLIAGIYPAIYAAKMSPAQALHKSM